MPAVPVCRGKIEDGFVAWLNGAEDSGGEGDECADKFERSAYRDADNAEGQQDQPDDRVKEQRGQGHRPADDKQDAEDQELHRFVFPSHGLTRSMKRFYGI
jgi:hypothetical protein